MLVYIFCIYNIMYNLHVVCVLVDSCRSAPPAGRQGTPTSRQATPVTDGNKENHVSMPTASPATRAKSAQLVTTTQYSAFHVVSN